MNKIIIAVLIAALTLLSAHLYLKTRELEARLEMVEAETEGGITGLNIHQRISETENRISNAESAISSMEQEIRSVDREIFSLKTSRY